MVNSIPAEVVAAFFPRRFTAFGRTLRSPTIRDIVAITAADISLDDNIDMQTAACITYILSDTIQRATLSDIWSSEVREEAAKIILTSPDTYAPMTITALFDYAFSTAASVSDDGKKTVLIKRGYGWPLELVYRLISFGYTFEDAANLPLVTALAILAVSLGDRGEDYLLRAQKSELLAQLQTVQKGKNSDG